MDSKDALIQALGLKSVLRAGWVRAGVKQPESVAAHSWVWPFWQHNYVLKI